MAIQKFLQSYLSSSGLSKMLRPANHDDRSVESSSICCCSSPDTGRYRIATAYFSNKTITTPQIVRSVLATAKQTVNPNAGTRLCAAS
jgi:hypothetical protein